MNTIDTREAGGCFCRSRDRFEREFIRAKNADAKLYLLIENGTWEKAYGGQVPQPYAAEGVCREPYGMACKI